MDASILHADLDAFYASVVLLRRPELRGRPVIVGGGVVLSATYEARRFGVAGGMGGREARRLCPHAVWVSGEFGDYVEKSNQVFEVFRRYTPLVETISIDEAFLDVRGVRRILGEPSDIARRLREAVLAETGLVVSVGVARTKFLAKVASQVAKPDGLVAVDPLHELEFLHALPVGMVWGVGPVTEERLASYGVATVGELAAVPRAALVAWLGRGTGSQLHALAWNHDPRGVRTGRRAGSVGAQSAFGGDVRSRSEHERVLRSLADRVASRLRSKDRAGRTVTVRLRFADFQSVSRAFSSRRPVATAAALHGIASRLVAKVLEEQPGRGLSLLAISVSRLQSRTPLQMELPLGDGEAVLRAGTPEDLARERLESSVDELRARFGREIVGPGAVVAVRRRQTVPSMGLLHDALAGEP